MTSSPSAHAQQERLIESLVAGSGFPEKVPQVEHLQTHISHILLAGGLAYKIKKPLDLGFLDFSDLTRRRHFCEEEIRLNRRLAPQLYLDCIAIGGTPENPRLGSDPASAIEFAVRMRQFDRSQQLDELSNMGRLKATTLERLAQQLAAFHRSAASDSTGTRGVAEAVHAPVLENFAELLPLLDSDADRERLRTLRQWTKEELGRVRTILGTRNRQQRIRECHGDLHLGNIVLIEEQPVVFDCIEFNDSLRWIDVMSEIAFLCMDLEFRGHADLARVFLDRYLEATGDYDGLGVLPYYLVYRAMVRAKIAAIRRSQQGDEGTPGTAQSQDLRLHLELARRFTESRRPWLAITHGMSGSGKSTVADRMVREWGAIRLRSDVVRKQLHGLEAGARTRGGIEHGIYSADATSATYARLCELATRIIRAGWPVVVDAANLQRWQRARFRDAAAGLAVPFLILDCRAPKSVLRAWIRQRMAEATDPSEAGETVLSHQLAHQQSLEQREREHTVRLRTDSADCGPKLRQRIEKQLARSLSDLGDPGEGKMV